MRRTFAVFAAAALSILGFTASASAAPARRASPDIICSPAVWWQNNGWVNNDWSLTTSPYTLYWNSSPPTQYCGSGPSGSQVFYQYNTGRCMALNSTTRTIYEETSCSNSWDKWNIIGGGGANVEIQSKYNSACIWVLSANGTATFNPCNSGNDEDVFTQTAG